MRNSDRGNKFGGRRDGGRPTMYRAVCAECGKDCEVPFQPSGDKPVYCSTCFGNKGGNERRSANRDSGRRDFRDRDKQMFPATCDKCGKQCEVPFRPTEGKPVFCDACFTRPGQDNRDNNGAKRVGPTNAEQLASINSKLDNIMKALQSAGLATAPKKAKEPAVKKATAKKKSSKKK